METQTSEEFFEEQFKRLPQQVSKCLQMTGCDNKDALVLLKDISQIEKYLKSKGQFLLKISRNDAEIALGIFKSIPEEFEFMPGHRAILDCFVRKLKFLEHSLETDKAPQPPHKRPKCSINDSSCEIQPTKKSESSMSFDEINSKIVKNLMAWSKKQEGVHVQQLTENIHYRVSASQSPEISPIIICLCCNAKFHITITKGYVVLSNFTRHIKQCPKLKRSGSLLKQLQITNSFLPKCVEIEDPSTSSQGNLMCNLNENVNHLETEGNEKDEDISSRCSRHEDTEERKTDHQATNTSGTRWSREERLKRSLRKSAQDCAKITNYFPCLDKIEQLIRENESLKIELQHQFSGNGIVVQEGLEPNNLLRQLYENCIKNTKAKSPRHDDVIKNFSKLLLIWAGKHCYEFISKNVGRAIPSVRQVERLIASTTKANEGEIRIEALQNHLRNYGDEKRLVVLSEDATRCTAKISYDSETNQCVGFVPPLDSNGLPIPGSFPFSDLEKAHNYMHSSKKAELVHVVMVQSLKKGVPPFALMIFGTDNKYGKKVIQSRWKYVVNQLKENGITVLAVSSDGDPKYLQAMCESHRNNNVVSIADMILNARDASIASFPLLFFQDAVHLAAKMRTRLVQPSNVLAMGSKICSKGYLDILFEEKSKLDHGLKGSDLDVKDRQNFAAAERLYSEKTIELLKEITGAEGTATYLQIMRYSVLPFLKNDLSVIERIKMSFCALYFYRGWKAWLSHHAQFTVKNNFITRNAHLCVEVNAYSLLLFHHRLRKSNCKEAFLPTLLGSQQCEGFFRASRSMTSVFSTVVNFSVHELLYRLRRLDVQMELSTEDSHMFIPRDKKKILIGVNETSEELADLVDISMTIAESKIQALDILKSVGIHSTLEDLAHSELHSLHFAKQIEGVVFDHEETELHYDDPNDRSKLVAPNVDDYQPDEDDLIVLNKFSKNESLESNTDIALLPNSPYVKYTTKSSNASPIIRKTTALWLLQDPNRLSSDRTLRVRGSDEKKHSFVQGNEEGLKPRSTIKVGDFCAFNVENNLILGRVLQFCYLEGKRKSDVAYSSMYVNTKPPPKNSVGALCNWFELYSVTDHYKFKLNAIPYNYADIKFYLCTIPTELLWFENEILKVEKDLYDFINQFLNK